MQEAIDNDNPTVGGLEKAIRQVDLANDQLDDIINHMRSDMGIENIDSRLKKRAR